MAARSGAASTSSASLVGLPWTEHVCFLEDAARRRRDPRARSPTACDRCQRPSGGLRLSRSATRFRPTSCAGSAPSACRRSSTSSTTMVEGRRSAGPGQLRQLPARPSTSTSTFSISSRSTSTCTASPTSAATCCACRTWPATSRWCSPSSASTRCARGATEQAHDPGLAGARRVRARRRRHLDLLVDRRLVHRRLPGRGLGLRPGRPRAQPQAGVPRGAAALSRRSCRCRRPAQPKISVVICAYNAERTMDACLAVAARRCATRTTRSIVVNDGSTDRTLEIAAALSRGAHHLAGEHGPQRGAQRRHRGATGEIVAYTDSDCVVDPDWLTYLAYTFVNGGFVAVGGPEPAAAGGVAHRGLRRRVARAGRRTCCSTTRSRSTSRAATWPSASDGAAAIGGFDPLFRAAGDDVDLCWRLQNDGHAIGFSPAAMVWHFRRNTVQGLSQAADGLRRGRGAALFQASVPLQSARPVAVAGPHLRRPRACRSSRAAR